MTKYKVYMNQYVEAQVMIDFEIESNQTLSELNDMISNQIKNLTELQKFDPRCHEFPGKFVSDSFSHDLDYTGENSAEIEFFVEKTE